MAKRVEALRRLVSFSELLGTYFGIRMWEPIRSCSKDLIYLEIPIVTDNHGNDYIIKKNYITDRAASWLFRELSVHNLTNNLTVMSRHCEGDSRYGL